MLKLITSWSILLAGEQLPVEGVEWYGHLSKGQKVVAGIGQGSDLAAEC